MRRLFLALAMSCSSVASAAPVPVSEDGPARTDVTAWTEPRGAVRWDIGAGGTTMYALGVVFGARTGMSERLQVGTNIAHAAVGMVDVHAKLRVSETNRSALAVTAGAMWFDLGRAWYLPAIDPQVDELLASIDVYLLPLGLVWSRESKAVSVDVAAGWDQAWIAGRPDSEVLVLDGGVGVRRAWLAPAARVPLTPRLTWATRLTLPVYAMGRTVAVAEYQVDDGVVAGVRSSDWFSLPFGSTTSARSYLEVDLRGSHLRVGASTSAIARDLGLPLAPYLLWSMRVGP